MPSAVFTEPELLAAVAGAYLITDVWRVLGGKQRCHRATVWRGLGRAEGKGLVARFQREEFHIWELTQAGRDLLDALREAAPPEHRPLCPCCGSAAGSRLQQSGARSYTVLDDGVLRCRWCGDHTWAASPEDLHAAEYFDRAMHSQRDVFVQALRGLDA